MTSDNLSYQKPAYTGNSTREFATYLTIAWQPYGGDILWHNMSTWNDRAGLAIGDSKGRCRDERRALGLLLVASSHNSAMSGAFLVLIRLWILTQAFVSKFWKRGLMPFLVLSCRNQRNEILLLPPGKEKNDRPMLSPWSFRKEGEGSLAHFCDGNYCN